MRATNPASNEELFAKLSDDFVAGGYDVKRLIRTIMNSGVYQLSADSNASNQMDTKYYSRYFVKRLPAEVLLDVMSQVTGVPAKFSGYPVGTRALQLPDVQVQSQFLSAFGRPKRIICDAGERSSEPNVAQALHVINGDTLNKKLSDPEGYAALSVRLGLSDSRILDFLYLSAFSRYPAEAEKQPLLDALRKARATTGTPEVQRGESSPGGRRHGVGHAHQQGVLIQLLKSFRGTGWQPAGRLSIGSLLVCFPLLASAVNPLIGSLAFSPDGSLLALGTFQEVRIVDPATDRRILQLLPGSAEDVRALAFSSLDGKLLAAAGGLPARSGEVKLWDVQHRTELRTIHGHTDYCIYVALRARRQVPRDGQLRQAHQIVGCRHRQRKSAHSKTTSTLSTPWHSRPMASAWSPHPRTAASRSGMWLRASVSTPSANPPTA